MTNNVQDSQHLERRIAQLEQKSRHLRVAIVALIGVLVAALCGAQALPDPTGGTRRVIEADEYLLRDEIGRIRARLGMWMETPFLALYDESGTPRVSLGARLDKPNKEEVDVTNKGKTPQIRQALGSFREAAVSVVSWPSLTFTNKEGVWQTHVGLLNKEPIAALCNKDGAFSAVLKTLGDGSSVFSMQHEQKHSVTLATTKMGAAFKLSNTANGVDRGVFMSSSYDDNSPQIGIQENTPRVLLTTLDGTGTAAFADRDGNIRAFPP